MRTPGYRHKKGECKCLVQWVPCREEHWGAGPTVASSHECIEHDLEPPFSLMTPTLPASPEPLSLTPPSPQPSALRPFT